MQATAPDLEKQAFGLPTSQQNFYFVDLYMYPAAPPFPDLKYRKLVNSMSLIACTEPCRHQQDGYCTLTRVVAGGRPAVPVVVACVNFVPRHQSQDSGQRLSDIADPDQL